MEENQKIIVIYFLSLLIDKLEGFFDKKEIFSLINKENFESSIFGTKNSLRKDATLLSDREDLKKKLEALIKLLSSTLGEAFAEKALEDLYLHSEKKYSPAAANKAILPLLPERLLQKYRLSILTKEELQAMVVEKTKANEELKALDKRKTEFLSVVAHQLRTPLAGFKWGMDLMLKGSFGVISDQQKDFFTKAAKEIEHMIKLVEDMLTANKIEFSAYQLQKKENDIIELMNEAIDEKKLVASESGITLSFKHPESGIPKFQFDKERMLNIFQNILDNAIKYNKKGGKVEVELSFANNTISCIIRDDGIGIPASEQPELFSRFFRAPNARTIDPNGNGLGLYIAKNMVELHGGTIKFISEVNKGTTFFITLNTV